MTLDPGRPGHRLPRGGPPGRRAPDGKLPVLVSQNFYRHGDRFREENGEKFDKFVTGEFVVHTVYGCQVVVTNPTSSRQRLTRAGATAGRRDPGRRRPVTRRPSPVDLEPYRTQTIDYLFYFPRPGKFTHFPAHVAKNEQLVAAAPAGRRSTWSTKPTQARHRRRGTTSRRTAPTTRCSAFLNRENVRGAEPGEDRLPHEGPRRSSRRSIALLQERHVYHPTLWSYGLCTTTSRRSRRVPAARRRSSWPSAAGRSTAPLLTVDPVARHQYEHLEYKPLVNARAHSPGQAAADRQRPRSTSSTTASSRLLTYRTQLDDDGPAGGRCTTCCCRTASRRRSTAFARVNPEQGGDADAVRLLRRVPGPVRRTSRRRRGRSRRSTPTIRWTAGGTRSRRSCTRSTRPRARARRSPTPSDRGQQQGKLAATEPGFEFTLDAQGDADLTWQNLEAVHGELLPDGRGAAVQPQPVRAAVRRPVRVDPAERDREGEAAGGPGQAGDPAAGRACAGGTCWWR